MNLPTEPGWRDGLPRIRSRRSLPSECEVMEYAIVAPGGSLVAITGTEEMESELIQWLGRAYADRAALKFRALDEALDVEVNRAAKARELPKLHAR